MSRPRTRRILKRFLRNIFIIGAALVAMIAIPLALVFAIGMMGHYLGFGGALAIIGVLLVIGFSIYATADDLKKGLIK
jgi:preprotein translocase subunit SecY